ncbi:MAG: hypothetical protein V1660_02840 [archaeon]
MAEKEIQEGHKPNNPGNQHNQHHAHSHDKDHECECGHDHNQESHAEEQANPFSMSGMSREDQEKFYRLNILEQQAIQMQQQLEILDQQIIELQLMKLNLDEIDKSKEKTEILSSIGKNVYIKTELKNKELYVDIGAKTVIKKSIADTKVLIDKDINSLNETRKRIMDEFNQLAAEIQRE